MRHFKNTYTKHENAMTKKITLILMRALALYTLFFALSYINYLFHVNGQNYKFIFNGEKTIDILLTLFFTGILFVQVFAFWKLKKWSLPFYVLTSAVFQTYFIFMSKWTMTMLIAPIIIITIVLINYKNLE